MAEISSEAFEKVIELFKTDDMRVAIKLCAYFDQNVMAGAGNALYRSWQHMQQVLRVHEARYNNLVAQLDDRAVKKLRERGMRI